jgi:hypothetical protein
VSADNVDKLAKAGTSLRKRKEGPGERFDIASADDDIGESGRPRRRRGRGSDGESGTTGRPAGRRKSPDAICGSEDEAARSRKIQGVEEKINLNHWRHNGQHAGCAEQGGEA